MSTTHDATRERAQRERYFAACVRKFVRQPLAMAFAGVLVVLVAIALLDTWIAPYDPNAPDFTATLAGPSGAHLLGTDSLGRDVLSRLIVATGPALANVAIAVVVALLVAVPTGILAGLYKGWSDIITSRVADIVLAIPGIIILLMVLAMTQRNMAITMVALGLLSAPGIIRVVRGATLAVSEEPYISAAVVNGLTRPQIAVRHILRRVAGPAIVNASIVGASAILVDAGLNFLGLGVRPPNASWGSLLADAAKVLDQQSWLIFPAGGMIALAILTIVLVGDGIRDAAAAVWAGDRVHRSGSRPAMRSTSTATPGDDGGPSDSLSLLRDDDLLQVKELTVAFPHPDLPGEWVTTIDRVTFSIRMGETVGLVGESGCGKTLTGLSVLGLLPGAGRIVSGSIAFRGRTITDLSPRDRATLRGSSIAFISQEPMVALDPLFTVGSQISEAVRVHRKVSRRAARAVALDLLERVQIADPRAVARAYPHEISGGMAQRVAIAIALAGEPELLIADEPTTALDVTVQSEILSLLAALQASTAMSVIIVSHDWGVISTACDRAVVMYAGQVVEQGQVGEVVRRPRHPYSDGLLAANPRYAEPGTRLETIPGTVPPPVDWPAGCHFAARCPLATEACSLGRIPMTTLDDGRLVRCIHVDELIQAQEARS